ncbi:MAG TPA: hypothetical protein VN766_01910 [Stellaceae bacterium]|jgi:hypothetical protein|nr:hypothetical protein [Stellaceae bacterium]
MPTTNFHAARARVARHLLRRWTGTLPSEWGALQRELDHWARRGRKVAFWWRDDDAQIATPALDRLLELAGGFGLSLGLAVIPAGADRSLADRLARDNNIRVLQHGWNHVNHAPPPLPEAELAEGRDPEEVCDQLTEGRQRLAALFGPRFLPVLVPPHNQLSRHLHRVVEGIGYGFISSHGDFAALPMPSRNAHLDVIEWQTNQAQFASVLVRIAIAALRLRRYGIVAADLPIGILTHHLAHDEAVWRVTDELLRQLTRHPAVQFPAIEQVFAR